MAADALQQLGDQAAALLQQLSAPERRKLAADLARTMRATQAERIRANKQPDGTAMSPRKPRAKRGAIRRKMFAKLVKPAWLKATATANEATVEFTGSANRLATIHHFGLRDKINGKEVQYPERNLIGITDADIDRIEDSLLKSLTASL
ncbi:phage virion morphogenesis protein [Aeromonas jandaei]|uniref:Phage virion morphogenesis protein n=1 Tax=Aeromonas jandaei TaxID=650 RepID=A0A7T4DR43_AERJA|nr:phage virion morphogenesis protein [Aeromonas jandaei]QQB21184.1 phage virion morphogenesis protein [Aeromonas jandaei]UCA32000.1 phage virion morphogenesis protein [Aeromonas jandaei]